MSHAHAHQHAQDESAPAHEHDHDEQALTELLDLDGEVLQDYLSELTGWIAATAEGPVTRIVDLGSGTGTGTFALLRRFPGARVTAVDLDAARLARLQDRARELGLAERVDVTVADLDQPWPELYPSGPADLVWASMALHHVADPDRTLARILGLLRPGGSLAIAKTTALESFPRFLPDSVGAEAEAEAGAGAGVEDRLHQLLAGLLAEQVPEMGADWRARLTAAGFTLAAERIFDVALTGPLPVAAGRYAQLSLDRLRTGLADRLDPADLNTLALLVADEGADSVLHRDDLTVRVTRLAWLARRPS
jgi:SAM-dependent methyltransferase